MIYLYYGAINLSSFILYYIDKQKAIYHQYRISEKTLFLFDTLGLASFTINGVNAGMKTDMADNLFLVGFLGVLTGVGGGLIRDMMASRRPYIFVKHVYACASVIGKPKPECPQRPRLI